MRYEYLQPRDEQVLTMQRIYRNKMTTTGTFQDEESKRQNCASHRRLAAIPAIGLIQAGVART